MFCEGGNESETARVSLRAGLTRIVLIHVGRRRDRLEGSGLLGMARIRGTGGRRSSSPPRTNSKTMPGSTSTEGSPT